MKKTFVNSLMAAVAVVTLFTFGSQLSFAETPPQYILQWGSYGSGDGQFLNAQGIALDVVGNVHVADYYRNDIQKFSPTGGYLARWGGFRVRQRPVQRSERYCVRSRWQLLCN